MRYIKLTTLVVAAVTTPLEAAAQTCDGVSTGRVAGIVAGYAVVEAGAILVRHDSWWTGERTGFRFAWGGSASKGQDVFLHAMSSYELSQGADLLWRWACVPQNLSPWLGVATALALSLPKEIGDGLHEEQGFSGTDMIGNLVGATLPALRASVPPLRSIRFAVFYWPSSEFRNRAPGALPDLENDWAGHRYYVAFTPGQLETVTLPRWLGVAVGHSVDHWISAPPHSEWFVTLDVLPSGFGLQSSTLRKLASFADQIHFPLPGLKISHGSVSFGFY